MLNKFETIECIKEIFNNCLETHIYKILDYLIKQLNIVFSKLNLLDEMVNITINGFIYDSSSNQISNFFKKIEKPKNELFQMIYKTIENTYFECDGNITQYIKSEQNSRKNLLGILSSGADVKFILHRIITKIQEISNQTITIGKNCSIILINKNDNNILTSFVSEQAFYSFQFSTTFFLLPSYKSSSPINFQASQLFSGPTINTKHRCWCGSNKKFKYCHFKKFGQLYAYHQYFNKPLFPFFRVSLNPPHPNYLIGNSFCVSSQII